MTWTQASLTISSSLPFSTIALFSQEHAGLYPLETFAGHLNMFVLYFIQVKGGIHSL